MPAFTSTLTCPQCGGVSTETMPTDFCQYYYDCRNCGAVLKALPGDCCVYCSYGDTPCPPIQEQPQGRHAGEHDGTAARAKGESGSCCAS